MAAASVGNVWHHIYKRDALPDLSLLHLTDAFLTSDRFPSCTTVDAVLRTLQDSEAVVDACSPGASNASPFL